MKSTKPARFASRAKSCFLLQKEAQLPDQAEEKAEANTALEGIVLLMVETAVADIAVGNDTGPMHLIAAAGAPSVVLFSAASDTALAAPRGKVSVLRADDLATVKPEAVWQAVLALVPAPQAA